MTRRRPTVAQHARLSAPTALRQVLTVAAVSLLVIATAIVGTVAYSAVLLTSEFAKDAVKLPDEVAQPPAIGAYEGAFTMLVVGTDECEPQLVDLFPGRCTGPDAGGRLNDVNMLVHVSDAPRRVTVVSFPRDLQIGVPSCTDENGGTTSALSKAPINSTYGIGGVTCVASTIKKLSGLDIPFAAKASFANVIAITDAIGGVEVCIGEGGLRDLQNTGIDWPAGPRTIQGIEALQFLRVRHGVGDGSDLARIGNQQQYLSSLTRKLSSEQVLGDPGALLRLANTAVQNITPSESLANPLRIVQLALAAKDVAPSDITFVQFPVVDDPADRNKVVPDQAAAAALWDALAQNRPLELTGDLGANGGVVADPAAPPASTAPADPAAPADPSADPSATASAPVQLPSNVNGSTAAQRTCSA